MLRLFVLILLLINGLYYAWSQGLLRELGFAPVQQTEPQRMGQQIRPEALRLLTAQELGVSEAVPGSGVKSTVCLQTGLFDAVQSVLLRRSLSASLPAGTWTLDEAVAPARWIVYMGKYANAVELSKKRAQLATLKLKFDPLTNPALNLGLSLGGFETQVAANAALEALTQRGVRTARVVQEHAEERGTVLQIPAADDAMTPLLAALKPALAGKVLGPCR